MVSGRRQRAARASACAHHRREPRLRTPPRRRCRRRCWRTSNGGRALDTLMSSHLGVATCRCGDQRVRTKSVLRGRPPRGRTSSSGAMFDENARVTRSCDERSSRSRYGGDPARPAHMSKDSHSRRSEPRVDAPISQAPPPPSGLPRARSSRELVPAGPSRRLTALTASDACSKQRPALARPSSGVWPARSPSSTVSRVHPAAEADTGVARPLGPTKTMGRHAGTRGRRSEAIRSARLFLSRADAALEHDRRRTARGDRHLVLGGRCRTSWA